MLAPKPIDRISEVLTSRYPDLAIIYSKFVADWGGEVDVPWYDLMGSYGLQLYGRVDKSTDQELGNMLEVLEKLAQEDQNAKEYVFVGIVEALVNSMDDATIIRLLNNAGPLTTQFLQGYLGFTDGNAPSVG